MKIQKLVVVFFERGVKTPFKLLLRYVYFLHQGFFNRVDEKFQHQFVINIGCCITELEPQILLPYTRFHNNSTFLH